MRLKVYRSATPPAESPEPPSPTPVALPSPSNAEPAAPGAASSPEEPPAKRRRHSCEEVAYQPPPPLTFDWVDEEWRQTRAAALNFKTYKTLKATPVVKGTVTTPPATTQPTRGDGNCYFRALSFFLTGTQSEHVNLRSILCEWMENHPNTIRNLADIENYMETSNMQMLGEYATDVELFCTASMLNTPIWTYSPYGKKDDKQHYQWQQHAPLPGTHSHFPRSQKAVFLKNTHEHFEPVLTVWTALFLLWLIGILHLSILYTLSHYDGLFSQDLTVHCGVWCVFVMYW